MPTLTKQYTLEITPEQFLKQCSSNELQEISLILDTHIKMKSSSSGKFKENLLTFHSEVRKLVPEDQYFLYRESLYKVKSEYKVSFLEFLLIGFTLPVTIQAMEIVNEICSNTSMKPDQIVQSMRLFNLLEVQRRNSITSKAQIIAHSD